MPNQHQIDLQDLHALRKTFPARQRISTLRRIALLFPSDSDDHRDLLRCADALDDTRTALRGGPRELPVRNWTPAPASGAYVSRTQGCIQIRTHVDDLDTTDFTSDRRAAAYHALKQVDGAYGVRPWVIKNELVNLYWVTTFTPITPDTPLPSIPSRGR